MRGRVMVMAGVRVILWLLFIDQPRFCPQPGEARVKPRPRLAKPRLSLGSAGAKPRLSRGYASMPGLARAEHGLSSAKARTEPGRSTGEAWAKSGRNPGKIPGEARDIGLIGTWAWRVMD